METKERQSLLREQRRGGGICIRCGKVSVAGTDRLTCARCRKARAPREPRIITAVEPMSSGLSFELCNDQHGTRCSVYCTDRQTVQLDPQTLLIKLNRQQWERAARELCWHEGCDCEVLTAYQKTADGRRLLVEVPDNNERESNVEMGNANGTR